MEFIPICAVSLAAGYYGAGMFRHRIRQRVTAADIEPQIEENAKESSLVGKNVVVASEGDGDCDRQVSMALLCNNFAKSRQQENLDANFHLVRHQEVDNDDDERQVVSAAISELIENQKFQFVYLFGGLIFFYSTIFCVKIQVGVEIG